MTAQEKLNIYLGKLKERENVLSVILFGSFARANNREGSDIDLLVVTIDVTKRSIEYFEGQAFEIVYTTEDDACKFYYANTQNAVRFWEVAQILFDRNGSAHRLQAVCEAIKAEGRRGLLPDVVAHARFDHEDSIRAVEAMIDTDPSGATFLLQTKVAALMLLYFDISQKWQPAPKQILPILRREHSALARLFDSFYTTNNVKQQIAIAKQIIPEVFS
jgi:predicted nucleotidyltransferase